MWGWSYGGYAAPLAATNDLYKCSIGVAVVDMKQQLSIMQIEWVVVHKILTKRI